mmetsp:Transcript_37717/g.112742  ORF Transcript_37717/g.112742 Transcript_37717/m.112742 type:complete len:503 (+) Transcript_37717:736-2244(+)
MAADAGRARRARRDAAALPVAGRGAAAARLRGGGADAVRVGGADRAAARRARGAMGDADALVCGAAAGAGEAVAGRAARGRDASPALVRLALVAAAARLGRALGGGGDAAWLSGLTGVLARGSACVHPRPQRGLAAAAGAVRGGRRGGGWRGRAEAGCQGARGGDAAAERGKQGAGARAVRCAALKRGRRGGSRLEGLPRPAVRRGAGALLLRRRGAAAVVLAPLRQAEALPAMLLFLRLAAPRGCLCGELAGAESSQLGQRQSRHRRRRIGAIAGHVGWRQRGRSAGAERRLRLAGHGVQSRHLAARQRDRRGSRVYPPGPRRDQTRRHRQRPRCRARRAEAALLPLLRPRRRQPRRARREDALLHAAGGRGGGGRGGRGVREANRRPSGGASDGEARALPGSRLAVAGRLVRALLDAAPRERRHFRHRGGQAARRRRERHRICRVAAGQATAGGRAAGLVGRRRRAGGRRCSRRRVSLKRCQAAAHFLLPPLEPLATGSN